jgi:hypothetical protein
MTTTITERGTRMRVQPSIRITVVTHYLDIEGLRFPINSRTDAPVAEWDRLRATMDIDEDGTEHGIYVTGAGHYVKKDGTVGLRNATISVGSYVLRLMPEDWQERIRADLRTLADRVTVQP